MPPSGKNKDSRSAPQALLLGLGLDNRDGHLRLTRGDNFRLIGGSRETHERMQEKALKFNEELKRRRRRMEDLTPNELRDVAEKAKLGEG